MHTTCILSRKEETCIGWYSRFQNVVTFQRVIEHVTSTILHKYKLNVSLHTSTAHFPEGVFRWLFASLDDVQRSTFFLRPQSTFTIYYHKWRQHPWHFTRLKLDSNDVLAEIPSGVSSVAQFLWSLQWFDRTTTKWRKQWSKNAICPIWTHCWIRATDPCHGSCTSLGIIFQRISC